MLRSRTDICITHADMLAGTVVLQYLHYNCTHPIGRLTVLVALRSRQCASNAVLYRRIGVIVLLVYVSDCRVPAIEYEWFGGLVVWWLQCADSEMG